MMGQPVVWLSGSVHAQGVVGHHATDQQEKAKENDEADKGREREQLLGFHGGHGVGPLRHVAHRPANIGRWDL